MSAANTTSFMFRNQAAVTRQEEGVGSFAETIEYDIIVIGSGNGACGFLGEVQKYAHNDELTILVLEEGMNFFNASDMTHQSGWSKTYSSSTMYKTHNTVTPDNRSILSGRACTLGGGGSINYTMMYDSSDWYVKNVGFGDLQYWNTCKQELGKALDRPDPFQQGYRTPFAEIIEENSIRVGGSTPPSPSDMIENIPSFDPKNPNKVYIFPTQFNQFGQRTHSSVSLVKWKDVTLRWNSRVTGLVMEEDTDTDENKNGQNESDGSKSKSNSTCTGVTVENTFTGGTPTTYKLKKGGRVILACGSQSPRLLLNTDVLASKNEKIGQRINDHICMLGPLYLVNKKEHQQFVGLTDNYQSLFTVFTLPRKTDSDGGENYDVVNIDYFSGDLQDLIYLASSLFLSLLIPVNFVKRLWGRYPWMFTLLSNTIRVILMVILYGCHGVMILVDALTCSRYTTIAERLLSMTITTSLVKFNASREGYYEKKKGSTKIILKYFDTDDSHDYITANQAFEASMDALAANGDDKFPFLIHWLIRILLQLPYKKGRQIKKYVQHFAQKTLLSEQHMAGGCIWGDVIDTGSTQDPSVTGKVFHSTNIHVADLSTCPLPRVSTQMSAYLMGHHVGKQLYSTAPPTTTTTTTATKKKNE